jgi:hypothetical protein
VVLSFLSLAHPAWARDHLELTPSISVSETYDDNIDLDHENEESDFITTITPGLAVSYLKEKTKLDLKYSPGFVFYAENTDENTIRHAGTLALAHQLSKNLKLDLKDDLLRAEDPLEDAEDRAGSRTRRQKYWRNSGEASLTGTYGHGRDATVGYRSFYTKSDDQTENDGTVQTGFGKVSHWFDTRNGVALTYDYTDANLSAGDDDFNDDFTGHTPGFTLNHRFTPHTMGFTGYTLTTRDFEDELNDDYVVHTATVGGEHAFSKDLSVSAMGGYFYAAIDGNQDADGPNYALDLKKAFEHASVNLTGEGGWSEDYLDAERTTFTRYHQVGARAEYQFLEPLTGYVNGSYRWNEDGDDQVWEILQGGGGLRWVFLRWYTAALEYTYRERSDDVAEDEYKDNRVMLILTASKLYRIW